MLPYKNAISTFMLSLTKMIGDQPVGNKVQLKQKVSTQSIKFIVFPIIGNGAGPRTIFDSADNGMVQDPATIN